MRIHAVGGYDEIGRNMTCLETDRDAFVFDSGLFLPPIVEIEESERQYTEKFMRSIKAIPDDFSIEKIRNKIRAILVSHAHLDHVGALPYIGNRYKAGIYATPYTTEFLKTTLKENDFVCNNKIIPVQPNNSFSMNQTRIEFLNITHSILQAVLPAVHTKKGAVVYANDFKFDNTPILGKKPNYDRIRQIGKQGVKALVVESIYADLERKTPSEKIAQGLLEDVLLTTENKNSGIIVTTFASHIARLKSIVDTARKLNRKVIFIGRSLSKYVYSAHRCKLVPFIKNVQIASYKKDVTRLLSQANKNRKKYLLVVTGHQGEPFSVLDRLSRNMLPYKINGDHVIFSSKTIPNPINIANKEMLEKRLKRYNARIFSDVHVSGHCAREDLRDLITMLNPEHIIPAHAGLVKRTSLASLAEEMGYKLGKNVHLMSNGQKLEL